MTALAPRNKSLHITTHLINSLKLLGKKKIISNTIIIVIDNINSNKNKKNHPRIKGIG